MRAIALVLVTILMIGLAGVPAFSQSPPHLQAKQALALVETSAGTGSGFAVGPNLVATACHVIKGATAIRVHFWATKMQANGRQVLCNEQYDIAFIATAVPDGTSVLQFIAAKPAQGEQVWVWGYPLGTTIALEPSVAIGIVSATETAGGFIALDISGAPGNSGGPVVNADGKVIGILVGAWNAGAQGSTGFKYAASGTTAGPLMADLGSQATAQQNGEARPAEMSIRPGEGVGLVRLGMTPAQVQEAVGLAASARNPNGWYEWETRKLSVYFDQGKAIIIYTEDAALATAEGVRLGSTDVDLVKTYGTPVCSSLFSYGGRAHLAWVYRGMFAFLTGAPRRIEAVAVFPAAAADAICR